MTNKVFCLNLVLELDNISAESNLFYNLKGHFLENVSLMYPNWKWRYLTTGSATSSPELWRMGGVLPLPTSYFYKHVRNLAVTLYVSFPHNLSETHRVEKIQTALFQQVESDPADALCVCMCVWVMDTLNLVFL